MAIKKEGLAEVVASNHKLEVERIEKIIDKELKEEYVGRAVSVELRSGYPHEKVRIELKRRYEEAG
jgi:hypothetical protein